MKQVVVCSTLCPLMSAPTFDCERRDEALFGFILTILETFPSNWFYVRTHYGYQGYVSGEHLWLGDSNPWQNAPKWVVTQNFCDIQAQPKVQSYGVAQVTRGALLSPLGNAEEGWQKVLLPCGEEGYVRQSYLRPYQEPKTESLLREALVTTAKTYLGTSYRWGGKTPLGIDCSGFTSMTYLMQGISIYRDAQIKEGFPLKEIPKELKKEGDLLYFPGHIALYLGQDRYIHATAHKGSDGVVINSLHPEAEDYRADLAQSLYAVASYFRAPP